MEEHSIKRTVVLTLTNCCNLHCSYCYEGMKNNRSMSFETARRILEQKFAANTGNELQIDFHGGEPLYCFDIIRQICEWAFSEKRYCKYIFFVGTNGTLLTRSMKQWFIDHKDRVWLGLSLDGNKWMHDVNRSNSFDNIDLSFFSQNWPGQPIKMTISKETLPYVADGVIFAHESGFEVSFNLAYGIEWSDDLLPVYQSQMDRLVTYYISHPQIKRASNFEKKLVSVFSDAPLERHCGAGKYMEAYDTEGVKYPCHMFSSNTLETKKWQTIADADFADEAIYEDAACGECSIRRLCPTCYGMNFIERGNIRNRDKRLCGFNKINTLSICNLRYHELIDKPVSDFSEDEYAELKAIQYLYNKLQDEGFPIV